MSERFSFGHDWIPITIVDVGTSFQIQITGSLSADAAVSDEVPVGNVGELLMPGRLYGVKAGEVQVWLRCVTDGTTYAHVKELENIPPGHKGDYSPDDYSTDYFLFQHIAGPAK
ncbi:MAG TPA: hypothetical protein EYN66_16210 [Myxococcales bacterium]|nr:hypothetical protein [Myxococcales bacterium]